MHNLSNENFSVAELADELGLSTSQTLRKIKKRSGRSANQLIRDLRLEHAALLLKKKSDSTISEIAYDVGFSSPSYFIKCFHEKYDVTPGDYLKNQSRQKSRLRLVLLAAGVVSVLLLSWVIVENNKDEYTHPITSIAVLPILDLSDDQSLDYLALGITDDLTHELSNKTDLRVISRGSALYFRDSILMYSDIANKLGVDLLLEGSLLKQGENLRLIVQLIQPFPHERHLWSGKYELGKDEVYRLSVKITEAMTSHAGISKSDDPLAEAIGKEPNSQAYDYYLRARHLHQQQNPVSVERAIEYAKDAIANDSSFAPAYTLLARCYVSMNRFIRNNDEKLRNKQQSRQMIYEALNMAIAEDEGLAEAYITHALLAGKLDWDWERMKEMADKGLELNPNIPDGYLLLSDYWEIMGDMEKSIDYVLMAEQLDPMNPQLGTLVAQKYELNRDYDKSLEQYEKVLELHPNYGFAWNGIGFTYYLEGQKQQTLDSWGMLHRIMGNESMSHYFSEHGFDESIDHWLEEATKTQKLYCSNPSIIAMAFMVGQRKDNALEYLEYAFDMQNEELPYLINHPVFDSVRGDLKYQSIRKALGLETQPVVNY